MDRGTLAAALLARPGRRVLLVGGRGSVAALDTGSRAGRRVRALMPSTPFDAVNLCSGDWDPRLGAATARSLFRHGHLAGREVCLLGRKVLRAFLRLHPALDALAAAPPFSLAVPTAPRAGTGWAPAMVWWAPHPSGRNRWWNTPANRTAGEAFFRYVLGRTEFPVTPPMPAMSRGILEVVLDDLGGGG